MEAVRTECAPFSTSTTTILLSLYRKGMTGWGKKATIPGNGKGPYRPQREADKGTFIFTISCTMQIYRTGRFITIFSLSEVRSIFDELIHGC